MKYNIKCLYLFCIFIFASNFAFGQRHHKPVVSKKYEYQGPFCNGLARVKLNRKWGYIDTTGALIVSPKYDEVENFSEGLARVRVTQKGWGLINTSGIEIVKPMFQWIYDFQNGKAKVKAGGQEGYIDRNGNLIR